MTIDRVKTWAGLIAALSLTVVGVACKDDGPSGPCYDACALAGRCDVLEPDETLDDCYESCDFIEAFRDVPEFSDCADALDVAFECASSLSCEQAEIAAACELDPMCDGDGVPCYDEAELAELVCNFD